jgi:hypothetical protein
MQGNAGLMAIMAVRVLELDPGWPGTAAASATALVRATPDPDNDDAFE